VRDILFQTALACVPHEFDRRYIGWMKQALTLVAVIGLGMLQAAVCAGQDAAENDPSQMSRGEWQARVKASQQRADVMRREHKLVVPQPRRPEDMDEEASRRILEDDSLAPGDIVSTRQGLFEFRGSPDRERKPDDFVRIR
jgi:hypothetical protein